MHAGRLLEDAQCDSCYQSWLSKIQAALWHCCGRMLRRELQRETRLLSVLIHVAERLRSVEKARRKVGKLIFHHSLPHFLFIVVANLFILLHYSLCLPPDCFKERKIKDRQLLQRWNQLLPAT